MSAFATAGAVAWVTPEILTATPAAGATLSAPVSAASIAGFEPPSTSSGPGSAPVGSTPLAFTGVDIERDAEVGAALIAGGWALHHWASRMSPSRPPKRPDAPA